jgi:hypothetical protein
MRPESRWPALLLFVTAAVAIPAGLRAQMALVGHGQGGVSVDIDDQDAASGAGFSFLTGLGIRLRTVEFGGEFGHHMLGRDRKAKQYGGWLRVFAPGRGGVRAFLVVGVANYRYSPATGSRTQAMGGSIGPGVLFPLGDPRAGVFLEARFHSGFDRLGVIASQEFLSLTAGLRLGL